MGLNHRPADYESAALPLSYAGMRKVRDSGERAQCNHSPLFCQEILSEKILATLLNFRYILMQIMTSPEPDFRQPIEPLFLSRAKEQNLKLRIGQMNKLEHEGFISDIGRYEINIDVNGTVITLLKQEISHLTANSPVIPAESDPADQPASSAPNAEPASSGKPNIQQEFLDKAIKERQLLTFFLLNGQRVKAGIEAFDNFTILLRDGDKQHLYYKHAISTINR